jgi:hypothetical protein
MGIWRHKGLSFQKGTQWFSITGHTFWDTIPAEAGQGMASIKTGRMIPAGLN